MAVYFLVNILIYLVLYIRKLSEINVSINDCDAEVWHTPGSPAKFELM